MKLKRLFSVIGLGLFAVTSVAAGVLAFAKGPKMEVAKADDPDDKMFTVIIDMGDAAGFDGFNSPEVHCYDSSTSTFDKYQMLHKVTGTYYTGTLTYRSADQTIDTIEFLFKQGEDKFSNSLSINPLPGTACIFSFGNTWTQDPSDGNRYEWELTQSGTWNNLRFQYYGSGDNNITASFVPDVATKSYKATFEIIQEGFDENDLGQIYFGQWGLGALRQSSIDKYTTDFSLNAFKFNFAGKFDIVIYDNYSDEGIMGIKLYSPSRESIYLVGSDITEDTRVYTFGESGYEEFGVFPGTPLKDIASAEEIHGDLKFQNEEYNIWHLELDMNYPKADHIILVQVNEHGVVGTQTADMLLVRGSAYWFSNDPEYHNDLAGASLKFLFEAEAIRKAATDQSVCEVPAEDATDIVNTYLSLGTFMQETYIDCTYVNTWKGDTKVEKEYVSYRAVIEELAEIADIDLSGTRHIDNKNYVNNAALTITIIAIVTISFSGVVTFVFVRKRKHQ